MKKVILIFVLCLFVITIFPFRISALGGMEISGRNRMYGGLSVGLLSFPIGILADVYLPLSSLETIEQEIEEARFVEVNPYLALTIPIFTTKIYAAVAPIFIFDIEQLGFSFFNDWVKLKAGMQFGKGLVLFIEGMTSLNFDFELSGNYAVQLGIGLGF
jgi:hypothetical protein